MRTNNFDPLAYIESAFLDGETGSETGAASVKVEDLVEAERIADPNDLGLAIPNITDYLRVGEPTESGARIVTSAITIVPPPPAEVPATTATVLVEQEETEDGRPRRFRKTVMSAPRPRRSKALAERNEPAIHPDLQHLWQSLPRVVEFLASFYDDSVTKNYYRTEVSKNSSKSRPKDRQELIRDLLDPKLSLEETSRLLGVCPATVRRYTNRGWLTHHRTEGGQRRFRLSDIVKFVDTHGRFPQE